MLEDTRIKISTYRELLTAKRPEVADFVAKNENDAEFMLWVRLHATLYVGLMKGIQAGKSP